MKNFLNVLDKVLTEFDATGISYAIDETSLDGDAVSALVGDRELIVFEDSDRREYVTLINVDRADFKRAVDELKIVLGKPEEGQDKGAVWNWDVKGVTVVAGYGSIDVIAKM